MTSKPITRAALWVKHHPVTDCTPSDPISSEDRRTREAVAQAERAERRAAHSDRRLWTHPLPIRVSRRLAALASVVPVEAAIEVLFPMSTSIVFWVIAAASAFKRRRGGSDAAVRSLRRPLDALRPTTDPAYGIRWVRDYPRLARATTDAIRVRDNYTICYNENSGGGHRSPAVCPRTRTRTHTTWIDAPH